MNGTTLMKGTILALCLVGMLVLPAAAAPAAGQGTNGNANAAIDQGLKTDLWNNHMQFRLQVYDNNVQNANTVIGILGKYSIDTTQMQSTLSTITGLRPQLQTALQNQDRTALKSLNQQLLTLWKQLATERNQAIKDHYKTARTSSGTAAGGSGIGNGATAAAAMFPGAGAAEV